MRVVNTIKEFMDKVKNGIPTQRVVSSDEIIADIKEAKIRDAAVAEAVRYLTSKGKM